MGDAMHTYGMTPAEAASHVWVGIGSPRSGYGAAVTTKAANPGEVGHGG